MLENWIVGLKCSSVRVLEFGVECWSVGVLEGWRVGVSRFDGWYILYIYIQCLQLLKSTLLDISRKRTLHIPGNLLLI